MKRISASKTLLAMAITAASMAANAIPLQAATYDLSGATGSKLYSGQAFSTLGVSGSLPNIATATAIVGVYGTSVSGAITNSGKIATGIDGVAGFDFDAGSQVGSFTNSGSIQLTGADAEAVLVDGHSSILGDFTNTGTLSATGTDGKGMYVIESSVFGAVINQGTIGGDRIGIDIDTSTYHSIRNLSGGTIAGLDGIILDSSAQIDPDVEAIYNAGKIIGTNTAIIVAGSPDPVNIRHAGGLISGGDTAIDGSGETNLFWTGGDIEGDLVDMSSVETSGSGYFSGSTFDATDVQVTGGALNLQGQTTDFTNNLTVKSGAALGINISDASPTSAALVTVDSTATFEESTKLLVSAKPGMFNKASTLYHLLEAGTIAGSNNLTVESGSFMVDVEDFNTSVTDVFATLSAKTGTSLAQGVTSPNGQAATKPFIDQVMPQLDADDAVFQSFAAADTAEEFDALASQLAPVVNSGTTQAALEGQSLVNNVLSDRSSSQRAGANSGDALADTGIWMHALTSKANQDTRDGVEGYDADTSGFALGADGKLNDEMTVGLAYSHLTTDIDSDPYSKVDSSSNSVTAYGNWARDAWFVDSSVIYGASENDSKRYVAGTTADADYDSSFYGLNATVGYTIVMANGVIVEPLAGARYSNVSVDGYSEKGSSAALDVGSQKFQVGEIGAGARVATSFPVGQGFLEPEAKAMVWHDFIQDEISTSSTFVQGSTAFVATGVSPVSTSYDLNLGLNYRVAAWTIGGSYDYATKTGFDANTFTAKARYDF